MANFSPLAYTAYPWPPNNNNGAPNGNRSDWKKTRFCDLQDRDEIILSPSFCGHKQQSPSQWVSPNNVWATVDSPDFPIWNGYYGRVIGKVVVSQLAYSIGATQPTPHMVEIHWDNGRMFGISGYPEMERLLYEFGFVLLKNFNNLSAQPTAQRQPRPNAIYDHPGDVVQGEPKPPEKKKVEFDDVIISKKKKQQILEAIAQVDHYDLIFNQWGFADKLEKGRAISILLWGPPGTGKTLMGQAIADKYDYKLQIISTAEIQSSEPGGAERAIKAFFKAAQDDGQTVLLFDECDSLIHDRAQLGMILGAEVNALLTELEKFEGIVIFTTNQLGVLDPAFERRLSLKLEFPMPTAKQRIKIWKGMFPTQAPLSSKIRWEGLAQASISGGHIKNVVLKAARRAAAGDKLITDEILWDCLEEEVEAMELYHSALNTVPRALGPGLGVTNSTNMNQNTIHRSNRR